MTDRIKLQPARYAIVGSREWPYAATVRQFIRKLPAGSTIISGGARGVDTWAETFGRECGLEVIVFPADWDNHGTKAGILRNADIVAAADIVVAFWFAHSRGTANSIERARAAGKPCWVCTAPGQWDLG